MDPQWNLFQPPISEPSLLDYNRSYSLPQANSFPSQSSNLYNGFYDSQPNPNSRNSKSSSMISPSYTAPPSSFFNSNSSRSSSHSHVPARSPDIPYSPSSYYSSSSNSNSNSQYVPPISDFKIGTFTLNSKGYPNESNNHDSSNNFSSSNNSNSFHQSNGSSSSSTAASQSVRETGIIEKLLQTYGFIQCCERQARLFFHFSQFDGNTEHLRIGDPVEFEVTFDRRTGKPIASTVTKISPEVVLSEERVVGIVTTELKSEHSGGEQQGRITYENRGECFFLPYGKEDVEGYVTLKPGDKVSFQIATNQRSGNLAARHVRLENPVEPVKYQGVVSAIKDSYGFIERADVVDEIFFHFSEVKTIPFGLNLGDDVEFLIQTRNGKEVATNMVKLTPGTVVFEDINPDEIRGQVLKPVEKALRQNQKDPLTGRIRYRGKDRSEVEVKFGERDQRGDFTLRHGDWVKFNIATDRRDSLQKATNISLLDESFHVSGEKREQGLISSLKDGFGFIKCADRDAKMFFHYNELLDPQREICLGEEVEFTVVSDQTAQSPNRLCGIRIRRLAPGTVKFEVLIQEGLQGEVTFEPASLPMTSSTNGEVGDSVVQPGIISFTYDNVKQTVNFYPVEGKKLAQIGDKVEFNIYLLKRTKERVAMDIKVHHSVITSVTPIAMSSSRQSMVGSGRTIDRGSTNVSTLPHSAPSGSPPSAPTVKSSRLSYTSEHNSSSPRTVADTIEASFRNSMQKEAQNGFKHSETSSVSAISTASSSPPSENGLGSTDSPPTTPTSKTLSNGSSTSNKVSNNSGSSTSSRGTPVHQGYIATLKDSFGFIETLNHDKEIFFHFSNVDSYISDLELGQEVEYTISMRTGPGGKLSAENVRVLPVGTIPAVKILGKVYEGTILRSLRSVNPDQQEYCGIVCNGKEEEKLGKYHFGITGLVNKKELLQPGDLVTFQLDEDGWAVNIRAIRKKLLATVETIKGQYGFLNYGAEEGKRLFFHQSEVKDNVTLSPGDEVQFVVITNLKTGKSSACNITRMLSNNGPSQRPDRLVSKLKSLTMDSTKPRIQVIRKPKGPDGTKGFKVKREIFEIN